MCFRFVGISIPEKIGFVQHTFSVFVVAFRIPVSKLQNLQKKNFFAKTLEILFAVWYNKNCHGGVCAAAQRLCCRIHSGISVCGSCATKHREPCQAGDRAALSGSFCVPQSTCTPMFRNFFVFWKTTEKGGGFHVQSIISDMASDVV